METARSMYDLISTLHPYTDTQLPFDDVSMSKRGNIERVLNPPPLPPPAYLLDETILSPMHNLDRKEMVYGQEFARYALFFLF